MLVAQDKEKICDCGRCHQDIADSFADSLPEKKGIDLEKIEGRSIRKDRLTAMGEIAAKIAHEVRNPLGSIELFATTLQEALEDQADLQILAEHISSGVKSINAIISNLLLFVKPDEKKEFDLFDIYEALNDSLFFTNHLTGRDSSIEVRVRYDQQPMFMMGDIELIKQVCLNIMLNAIQSMPNGGTLVISTSKKSASINGYTEWIEIRFSDTGNGIDSENIRKIFDPFFTLKKRGTGLGLSIVHSIVEIHGGAVDVDSIPGKGSVFKVLLPLFSE